MAPITPAEFRFRFAAWAAVRASQRGVSGLKVDLALAALRNIGFEELAKNPTAIPGTVEEFDALHHTWCNTLVAELQPNVNASYGVAAKVINVFIKALCLSDFGSIDPSVSGRTNVFHPPVDRQVLNGLAKSKTLSRTDKIYWRRMRDTGWTRFDQDTYNDVIRRMRILANNELWRIEAYWSDHAAVI
ncbi:hypothetical protein KMP13_13430 [Epibacterium ulvae]|uniref:hypothetical protein n=1 Tax=Epibacterium ulvae TaxID=1156985 RepID=UPI001BFCC3BD|nr:hypothetical protein [Epibacterium ulvae]MBT8154863.1 hypothetical protein [Epibacterium ulvae]